MTRNAWHLASTADEKTWKFDKPMLFLGEWCRLYDRKSVWAGLDTCMAEPFGLDPKTQVQNFEYVLRTRDQLLSELGDRLNALHGKEHGVRYWNILLGYWLRRYVTIIFNRFFTIQQACRSFNVTGYTARAVQNKYSFTPQSSIDVILNTYDDRWNQNLDTHILKFLNIATVKIEEIQSDSADIASAPVRSRRGIKRIADILLNHCLPKLSKSTDALILNSYLSRWREIQLQISLAQFPQNWRSPPLTPTSVNEHLRNGLSLNQDSYSSFERFIRERIWEMIPVCFLEGYSDLTRQIECLSWPRAPKFIFTSNNFDTDEVFKAYAAHHSEKGVPYFVGQHGNGYGTHRSNEQLPDLVSSDKFFSWGWTRPNSNVVPAFALSKIAGKKIKYDKAGILLLIEGNHPPRIELWDTTFNFSVYQEDQFVFVNTLPEAIRRRLVVRMFPTIGDRLWSPTQRWKDRLPKVHIQFKRVPMATMFKRSRITVHSFDSTSILESLSSNIPTVCFWRGGLEHLSPHAREDYERLREVGILTETAESAANHVAAHWDDVDAWWLGDQLQIARKTFCEKYARTNSRPIRTLRKLLTSA